jgi:8-oxo-dGTP diphosphatase
VTKQIHVVGAVIIQNGLVLCAQRGQGGSLAGLWEFPGGKIESGESPAAALKREIAEELDCTIEVGDLITTTVYVYEFGTVNLTTFYCRLTSGTPTTSEHAAIRWLRPADFATIEWAPADIPAIHLIQEHLA